MCYKESHLVFNQNNSAITVSDAKNILDTKMDALSIISLLIGVVGTGIAIYQ